MTWSAWPTTGTEWMDEETASNTFTRPLSGDIPVTLALDTQCLQYFGDHLLINNQLSLLFS